MSMSKSESDPKVLVEQACRDEIERLTATLDLLSTQSWSSLLHMIQQEEGVRECEVFETCMTYLVSSRHHPPDSQKHEFIKLVLSKMNIHIPTQEIAKNPRESCRRILASGGFDPYLDSPQEYPEDLDYLNQTEEEDCDE